MQAIRTVISSSFPHQINVDNSQIVLSPDNHVYRLILTTSTTYLNGKMDVNIYIVEALTRPDHGDLTTTRLLKGLELASRFRFMFLEKGQPVLCDESPIDAGGADPCCRQGPGNGAEPSAARRPGSGTS